MGPTLASTWTQAHPPKPSFTEKDLDSLQGKVYIVTGGNTGVGKELVRILYSKHAKVYLAARSEQKATSAIHDIKEAVASSSGQLEFLDLDLDDLEKVKKSAQSFLAKETKLNVLFNNAGVMTGTEPAPKTKQGYEKNLGVNAVGTFLFTKLLTPLLIQTARTEAPNTVRVTWPSSFALELYAEQDTAIDMQNLDYHVDKSATVKYGVSKTGVWALGVEYAKQHKDDGIISMPLNPGNLRSELARDQPFGIKLVAKIVGYHPVNGAYTLLYAGLSPEITLEKSGSWGMYTSGREPRACILGCVAQGDTDTATVVPFGRIYHLREDLVAATKTEAEGGNGGTRKFWDWAEEQVREYC